MTINYIISVKTIDSHFYISCLIIEIIWLSRYITNLWSFAVSITKFFILFVCYIVFVIGSKLAQNWIVFMPMSTNLIQILTKTIYWALTHLCIYYQINLLLICLLICLIN